MRNASPVSHAGVRIITAVALIALAQVASAQTAVALFRLYNPNGDHLLTTSCSERWSVQSNSGYVREDIGAYVVLSPRPGLIPLHRLFSGHEHFYTTAAPEYTSLVNTAHWNDEGVVGYISSSQANSPSGMAPLYRVYNASAGFHLLTQDFNERQTLLRSGWKDEGIEGTAWRSGIDPCASTSLALPATFYDHTYFRGSQHIETSGTLSASGFLDGKFRYENDSQWGFCGGVTVLLADNDGKVIKFFTPPTGCIDGKGIGGHAISREVGIHGQLSQAELKRVRVIKVAASETCAADKVAGSLDAIGITLDLNKAYQFITGCHA